MSDFDMAATGTLQATDAVARIRIHGNSHVRGTIDLTGAATITFTIHFKAEDAEAVEYGQNCTHGANHPAKRPFADHKPAQKACQNYQVHDKQYTWTIGQNQLTRGRIGRIP